MSSEPSEPNDYVFVGGKAYPAAVYHAALNEALLDRLERTLPEGATPRQAARAIQALKKPANYKAVMNDALARVAASGLDVPLAEAIRDAEGLPIAAFPEQLDKRIVGQ